MAIELLRRAMLWAQGLVDDVLPFNALHDIESVAWALVDLVWRRHPVGPAISEREQDRVANQRRRAQMIFADRQMTILDNGLDYASGMNLLSPKMTECDEKCREIWAQLRLHYTQLEQDAVEPETLRKSMSKEIKERLQTLVEHYTQEPVRLVPFDKDVLTYEEEDAPSGATSTAGPVQKPRPAPRGRRYIPVRLGQDATVPETNDDNDRPHKLRPRTIKRTREDDSSDADDTDERAPALKKRKVTTAAAPTATAGPSALAAPTAPAAPAAPVARRGFIGNGRYLNSRASRRRGADEPAPRDRAYIGARPPNAGHN